MIDELKPHSELIAKYSSEFNLDPVLVGAIIMQESRAKVWTARYEPNSKYKINVAEFAKLTGISQDTELCFQKTSWGLMHVMGVKARELGFVSFLPQLLLPSLAIEYGCRALLGFKIRYQSTEDVIASYNAGSPRRLASGLYVNQDYVDGVKRWISKQLSTSQSNP